MPGFYPEKEYDIAGFSVGIAERNELINISNVKSGDLIIALPSSGIHSNGFSLVRKIFNGKNLNNYVQEFSKTLGEELLTPTKIYVKQVLNIIKNVKSMAHITGGGFHENIPRCLPENLIAKIERSKIKVLPVFEVLKHEGNISDEEMFHIFNMGVGMVLIVSPENSNEILKNIPDSYLIGEVSEGILENGGVLMC